MLNAFDSADPTKLMDVANDWQVTFWPIRWWLDGNQELSASDQNALSELSMGLKKVLGHGFSADRLSLEPRWQNEDILEIWQKCLDNLSTETKQSFRSILQAIDLGPIEGLDSRYAHEVLDVLQQIIARVGALDKIPPLSVPNRSVQLAFEEAHRCCLYGFNIAAMVLCRATVESALKEALDAAGSKDPVGSLKLSELMKIPKARHLLGDLCQFADEVRQAGNKAVHDANRFGQLYTYDKIWELLLKTRRIVEHLYAMPNE